MSKGVIKAAVIGYPIKHSKSPLIHGHWIEKYGLEGSYEAIEVAPEDLESAVKRFIYQGYAGFNVTVPHKEAIMSFCDEIDETARSIGAVNTVVINDGKLYGINTDAYGFTENIKANEPDFEFQGGPALVLGAGGAAKAIVHALISNHVPEIRITNRTIEKSNKINELYDFSVSVIPWEKREEALHGINLLVNTTSLGMVGQPELDLDLENLSSDALINDIVYAPLMTNLLKQGQVNNNKVVTGIGMLLHQARPAFEKWFEVLPDIDAELTQKVLS